jgi:hypothetical protein
MPSIQKQNSPRLYPWTILTLSALLVGSLWGFIQVVLIPILPYFYIVWWIASAGAQFFIGHMLAYRISLRRAAGQPIHEKDFVAGVIIMFMSYFAAQVAIPLVFQGVPMAAVDTPFLPPLIIEGIILAAGLTGFFTSLRKRTA